MLKNKSINEMTLEDRIRLCLAWNEMTMMDLSKESGIAYSTLIRICSGKSPRLPWHKLQRIARALGVTSSQLMGEAELFEEQNGS